MESQAKSHALPLPPERIHPALWRASQLACPHGRHTDTGFDALSAQLPGQGWPLGALVEILTPQAGVGEIQLLRPALIRSREQHIALIQPPHKPQIAAWANWGGKPSQLLWIRPNQAADALWATEQILRGDTFGAAILWQDTVRDQSLRRLHLAAQQSGTLFIVIRPGAAAAQASPAPLRLAVKPSRQGLAVTILKRRGSTHEGLIELSLYPNSHSLEPTHATLDRRASFAREPGHRLPELAD